MSSIKLLMEQAASFATDGTKSRKITLDDWRNRPRKEKGVEWMAGLLQSQT